MATSKNGRLFFESGQTFFDYTAMTDSGDGTVYNLSAAPVFSGRSGFEPIVRPNGIVTGRNLLSASSTNDTVDVSAFTAYSAGTEYSVSATTATITRPAGNVSKVNSITMDDSGAIAVLAGTDGATANFSETRGAAGGPPEIPADSVEIGQVRVATSTAGAIGAAEIFQVVGTHAERYDLPAFTINNIGTGLAAETPAKTNAFVEFADALPTIHASASRKRVYIRYNAPIYAQVARAFDYVPAENTQAITSQQYYDGTVGSVSTTLGQGSFSALTDDNITDTIIGLRDQLLTFQFFPDKNKTAYSLTQGTMGVARTFPVDNQNQADITISAEVASADFSG